MKTTKWELDPTHSEIQFKVKHLMISTVTGQFNKFTGSMETDGIDFTTAKVHFEADVNSISTNNEQRDTHLRSGDFFEEEKHPKIIFEGDKLEKINDEKYKLHGKLTMRGTTKDIILDVEYGGVTQDPWGNTRVGFSAESKVNRKDFGISFSMISETGGILLAEDVKIIVNTQFVVQKDLVNAVESVELVENAELA